MRRQTKACRTSLLALLVIIVAGEHQVSTVSAQTNRRTPVRGLAEMRQRAARVEPHIRAAAHLYGVDPRALWTIAYLETRFQPGLVSPKGARGMMQFMPGTATRYGLSNPHDEVAAIYAAGRYVRDLTLRFDNRLDLVLASYNAGEAAVEAFLRGTSVRLSDSRVINPRRLRTGGVPPYTETRNYVSRGLFVARAIAGSGVFSPADLTASGAPLTVPPPAAATAALSERIVASNAAIVPPSPPAVAAAPTSSYALIALTTTPMNQTAIQRSANSVESAASTVAVARSLRASVIEVNNTSSSRVAADLDAPSGLVNTSHTAPPP